MIGEWGGTWAADSQGLHPRAKDFKLHVASQGHAQSGPASQPKFFTGE